MLLQHQEEIKSGAEAYAVDNEDMPTQLALELAAVCPGQARVVAVAMHEKLCERGNFTSAELWEAVLRKLREDLPRNDQCG